MVRLEGGEITAPLVVVHHIDEHFGREFVRGVVVGPDDEVVGRSLRSVRADLDRGELVPAVPENVMVALDPFHVREHIDGVGEARGIVENLTEHGHEMLAGEVIGTLAPGGIAHLGQHNAVRVHAGVRADHPGEGDVDVRRACIGQVAHNHGVVLGARVD